MKIDSIECMDVFEYLNNVDDNTIDLAVIDPPYNIDVAEWDVFESKEAFFDFTRKYLKLVCDKLKDTGSLYIFNTAFNSAYILSILDRELNMKYRNWIIWHKKDGFSPSKRKFVNNQETILYFTKSDNFIFNCEDIRVPYESKDRMKTAKTKGILKNGKRWFPNPNGKLCSDVWEYSSVRLTNKKKGKTVKQGHPTPKPEKMIERMIKASTNEGDLVMDLFSGTGTTAYVSKINNRHFTGCENNSDYVDLIKERLNDANL